MKKLTAILTTIPLPRTQYHSFQSPKKLYKVKRFNLSTRTKAFLLTSNFESAKRFMSQTQLKVA